MGHDIVELTVGADDDVIERKVVPYPYQTRQEVAEKIKIVPQKRVRCLRVISGGQLLAMVTSEGPSPAEVDVGKSGAPFLPISFSD
jgi:hypothetical protein